MSILLRSAPRSTILPLLRSAPLACRTYTTHRPLLVSGYGKNPSSQAGVEVIGGQMPEYSGPSISEKKKSAGETMSSSKEKEMKEKRTQEFDRTQYEHDAKNRPKKGSPATRVGNVTEPHRGDAKRDMHTTSIVRQREWNERENPADWRREQSLADMAKEKLDQAKKKMSHAKDAIHEVTIDKSDAHVSQSRADVDRRKDDLYPTSDADQQGGYKMPMSNTPEAAAASSGDVVGEDDVNSIRKSFFDGPQEMPQGVGKRAKNEQGKPMETGTIRS